MHRLSTTLFPTVLLILALACGQAFAAAPMPEFTPESAPAAPDYAKAESWLTQPEKPGLHPVDVFWAYPTVLSDREHWLMDPASQPTRKLAANSLIVQAGIFSGQTNLYAPVYRQMNMAALALPADQADALIQYGKDDMERAFTYYMEHLNQGRPFILAGHSQGSDLLIDYVIRNWGKLGCEDRLVAAYIIGWSITHDDLKANPNMTMCQDAKQVNCFISYNTVAQGRQDVAPTIRKVAVVTNPLTWTTDENLASATLNLGAVFFDDDGSTRTYPHFTSAQAKDSGLVVRPEDPKLVESDGTTFPKGVYHRFDYTLFFENLRQNVKDRIKAFQAR